MHTLQQRLAQSNAMVDCITLFVQPSIKHAHRILARQNLELGALGSSMASFRQEFLTVLGELHSSFAAIRGAILEN